MGLEVAVDLLTCPRCHGGLTVEGQLRCPNGHAYDVAKQGYVNLSDGPQPRNADTTPMVQAREAFLARGHYACVVDALATTVPATARAVVDAGAGPGYYAARVLDGDGDRRGLAIDVSVAACRRAARAHPRLGAVVADVWRPLPVRDGVVDVVLSVFAPRQAAEFARVLRPGGSLVTVTPAPTHLRELRAELELLGHDEDKPAQLTRSLSTHFDRDQTHEIEQAQRWDAGSARDAILMGPNAFHLEPVGLQRRLDRLSWPRTVTLAVRVDRWRRVS